MDTRTQKKPLNRDLIKYVAMLTMLLNHIAMIFLESGTWLCEIFTAVGYFTAITMIYFLVEGYHYTHSRKQYLLRLFLFALLSEIPYCLAFTQGAVLAFTGLNFLFTLCICFSMIWCMDTAQSGWKKAAAAILGIFLSLLCDWALLAPVFTLLFWWSRGSEPRNKAAFLLSILLFGGFNFLGGIGRFSAEMNILYALLSVLGMGIAGICILYFYNGKRTERGRIFSKWFFYAFYPVHLLILGLLRIIFTFL